MATHKPYWKCLQQEDSTTTTKKWQMNEQMNGFQTKQASEHLRLILIKKKG
jgi:hypothetical protein